MDDTLASRVYAAQRQMQVTEDRIARAMGCGDEGVETWPFDYTEMTFDEYDYSFEFKGVTAPVEMTPVQMDALAGMGFARCWFCREDGGEQYFSLRDPARKSTGEDDG